MDEAPRSKERRETIYLVGFMGCGKSTVGPILANVLGFDFTDIDKFIERQQGKRLLEIFATEGEQRFRQLEREALEATKGYCQHVISLGGGTLSSEEMYSLVHRNGILVYLQLSPEEILQRVSRRTDRPMLKDHEGNQLPPDAMRIRIRELLEVREVFFNRADIIVPADQRRLGSTVDEIVRRLRKHL
jgi:shikimate kinase